MVSFSGELLVSCPQVLVYVGPWHMSQWYLSFLLKHRPVKGDFKDHIVTQILYKPHLPVQHTEVKLGLHPNIPVFMSPVTLPKPPHILAILQESQPTPVNIVFLTSTLQLLHDNELLYEIREAWVYICPASSSVPPHSMRNSSPLCWVHCPSNWEVVSTCVN